MGKREYYKENNLKKVMYIFSFALIISIIIFLTILIIYNQKLKVRSIEKIGTLSNIVPNEEVKPTSFTDDLKISDVKKNANEVKNEIINKTAIESVVEKKIEPKSNVEIKNEEDIEIVEEVEKDPEFIAPIAGEIIKDYAMENLIYSNTLEEWTTHSGIDIKANKTSVVFASEDGIIESIKNDPRYGLTVIISHSNGYKTIYSNLLTTEFVSKGEKVEKGQTIATVGETASFEVSDENHLHFEIMKDGEYVNPTIYLK